MTQLPGVAKFYTPVALLTSHVETCVLLSMGTYRHAEARAKIDVELEDYYAIKDMKKSGE